MVRESVGAGGDVRGGIGCCGDVWCVSRRSEGAFVVVDSVVKIRKAVVVVGHFCFLPFSWAVVFEKNIIPALSSGNTVENWIENSCRSVNFIKWRAEIVFLGDFCGEFEWIFVVDPARVTFFLT
jgi:hypothetical protein